MLTRLVKPAPTMTSAAPATPSSPSSAPVADVATLLNEYERERRIARRQARAWTETAGTTAQAMLPHADDLRLLGPLLSALGAAPPGQWRDEMTTAVTARLWRIGSEDALSLNERCRQRLRGIIRQFANVCSAIQQGAYFRGESPIGISDQRTDLALAAMKALSLIGDEPAIRYLRRLAGLPPLPPLTHPNVRTAQETARECLSLLDEGVRQRRAARAQFAAQFKAGVDAAIIDYDLDAIGPDRAVAALCFLLSTARMRRAWNRTLKFAVGLSITIIGAALLMGGTPSVFGAVFSGVLGIISGVLISSLIADRTMPLSLPTEERAAALRLCRYMDQRLIGPLIEYAQAGGKLDIALMGVLERLPLLEPGDIVLLEPRHRAYLRGLLSDRARGRRSPLPPHHVRIVLDALGVIGDVDALPAARRIARQMNPETHGAAARCVERLKRAAGTGFPV